MFYQFLLLKFILLVFSTVFIVRFSILSSKIGYISWFLQLYFLGYRHCKLFARLYLKITK
jgi:hypothetical protein